MLILVTELGPSSSRRFRFSIYRPEEDELPLGRPLQMIEDREHGTITIEQG